MLKKIRKTMAQLGESSMKFKPLKRCPMEEVHTISYASIVEHT